MHLGPARSALTTIALCLCLSSQSQAQQAHAFPASDVERMALNPGLGSLLIGGGELLLKGKFRVGLLTHYQRAPLRMIIQGKQMDLIDHRSTAVVMGALGVLPWLEVDLQVPLVIMQAGADPSSYGLRAVASRGIGTPTVHARMGVLSRRAGHALDLSVDTGLSLPLGSTLAMAREPLPRLESSVLLGRGFGPVRAMIDAGLLLRVSRYLGPEALTHSRLGQELRLGAALGTMGDGVRFESALRTALALETGQTSTEIFAGARYPLSSLIEVFGLGGMGLGSLPGTPGFRVVLGVAVGEPPPPEGPVIRATSSQGPISDDTEEIHRPRPLLPPTEPNDNT